MWRILIALLIHCFPFIEAWQDAAATIDSTLAGNSNEVDYAGLTASIKSILGMPSNAKLPPRQARPSLALKKVSLGKSHGRQGQVERHARESQEHLAEMKNRKTSGVVLVDDGAGRRVPVTSSTTTMTPVTVAMTASLVTTVAPDPVLHAHSDAMVSTTSLLASVPHAATAAPVAAAPEEGTISSQQRVTNVSAHSATPVPTATIQTPAVQTVLTTIAPAKEAVADSQALIPPAVVASTAAMASSAKKNSTANPIPEPEIDELPMARYIDAAATTIRATEVMTTTASIVAAQVVIVAPRQVVLSNSSSSPQGHESSDTVAVPAARLSTEAATGAAALASSTTPTDAAASLGSTTLQSTESAAPVGSASPTYAAAPLSSTTLAQPTDVAAPVGSTTMAAQPTEYAHHPASVLTTTQALLSGNASIDLNSELRKEVQREVKQEVVKIEANLVKAMINGTANTTATKLALARFVDSSLPTLGDQQGLQLRHDAAVPPVSTSTFTQQHRTEAPAVSSDPDVPFLDPMPDFSLDDARTSSLEPPVTTTTAAPMTLAGQAWSALQSLRARLFQRAAPAASTTGAPTAWQEPRHAPAPGGSLAIALTAAQSQRDKSEGISIEDPWVSMEAVDRDAEQHLRGTEAAAEVRAVKRDTSKLAESMVAQGRKQVHISSVWNALERQDEKVGSVLDSLSGEVDLTLLGVLDKAQDESMSALTAEVDGADTIASGQQQPFDKPFAGIHTNPKMRDIEPHAAWENMETRDLEAQQAVNNNHALRSA